MRKHINNLLQLICIGLLLAGGILLFSFAPIGMMEYKIDHGNLDNSGWATISAMLYLLSTCLIVIGIIVCVGEESAEALKFALVMLVHTLIQVVIHVSVFRYGSKHQDQVRQIYDFVSGYWWVGALTILFFCLIALLTWKPSNQ